MSNKTVNQEPFSQHEEQSEVSYSDSCCCSKDDSSQNASDESAQSGKTQSEVSEKIEELDPIALLEKEKSELKDAYLRLSAETENYRKRIEQEKESFKKFAVSNLIEKLLPVADNLERSIKASENSEHFNSLKEGVNMVFHQFEGVLKDAGLEAIEVKPGDEFDPQIAEAVMMEERDDIEFPMTVVDVFETGRKLGGRIIRTAKVKIAKKK
ncbi:MAG: nucleotide exchange factor GrpE [Brevinemataceae bacterium]